MWRETSPTEPTRTSAPATMASPVTDEEWRTILDRMETTRDVFRQNRELRDVLSRREAETQALRNRNAELEDILHLPSDPTLSQLDSTLKRFTSFCVSYHGLSFRAYYQSHIVLCCSVQQNNISKLPCNWNMRVSFCSSQSCLPSTRKGCAIIL